MVITYPQTQITHVMKRLAIIITITAISLTTGAYAQSDTTLIKNHLTTITKTDEYRNYKNIKALNQIAEYIFNTFQQYADTTYYQTYEVKGNTYKNVICRFGTKIDKPTMIIGAHYDVCGNQEGADDNASGVVALLEIVRMLKNKSLTRPLELVAYTLEEPPFFRTPHMGSYVHAKSLIDSKTKVYGMAAIEMIGYFSDEKGSQNYPIKVMKVAYGTRGDFILLVKKKGYGDFVKNFSKEFINAETIETSNLKAPFDIEGIDFSDHLNYWEFGFDAMMVTNSAFFRNKNYHQKTDKMETLDIKRMANVIDAIYHAILNIDSDPTPKNNKTLKK